MKGMGRGNRLTIYVRDKCVNPMKLYEIFKTYMKSHQEHVNVEYGIYNTYSICETCKTNDKRQACDADQTCETCNKREACDADETCET